MRKITMFFIAILVCSLGMAQDQYLLFEFMKVDESQGNAYWETETFWSKIHQQRANNGDIIGWDLWQLSPGGEDQGYQYVTVQLYDDPVKMFSGGGDWDQLMVNAKKAYPKMTEADIEKKINNSSSSRDLAVRYYLVDISSTEDDFDMTVGTVASFDMMKTSLDQWGAYIQAENEVFKPSHQKMVDAEAKGSWSLAQVISPVGSDAYASHFTFNMFKDWKHYFDSWNYDGGESSPEMQKKMQAGMAIRDMKYVYLAELVMKVRKQ